MDEKRGEEKRESEVRLGSSFSRYCDQTNIFGKKDEREGLLKRKYSRFCVFFSREKMHERYREKIKNKRRKRVKLVETKILNFASFFHGEKMHEKYRERMKNERREKEREIERERGVQTRRTPR